MIENSRKKTPYLVVELLENFNQKELKDLQKIVSCAYFNTDRYVIKLLEVLIEKVLHQTNINQVIQLRLYNQVFNDQPKVKNELNQKQKAILRSKISALTRLAERFITIEALEQSNVHQYDLMLNALLDKKQYRLFSKHLKKGEIIVGNKLEQMNSFDFKYKLENCTLRYLYETGQWLKEDNLNQLIKIVDLNYLNKRMDYTMTALSFRTRKPDTNYDLSITSFIKQATLKQYLNSDYPYLSLDLASIELSIKQTDELYLKFISLIKKYQNLISSEKLKSHYILALNFCNRMTKNGRLNYINEYVNLQKSLDEKNLILNEKKISLSTLKNIVVFGCKAQEFKWVLKMIEKYSSYINSTYREDAMKFNWGYIAYVQKYYEKAIDYLLNVENFHRSYDIDKRMLILKSYYELEKHYTEPTAQLFRSIEAFVLNNKQCTEIDKKMYKNTIRIFYNLYRYKHGVGKITLDKLQQQVEEAEYIASKAWLLEKIEELGK